jgi:6-phosphogluconolactonase
MKKLLLVTLISMFAASVHAQSSSKAVFIASNGIGGNKVLHFERSDNGRLTLKRRVSTKGRGTGDFLANQNGLVLSGRRLLVVNAGSDELSLLSFRGGRLAFKSKVTVAGAEPVSVAHRRGLVYVVTAGRGGIPASISGYRIQRKALVPIEGSTIELSSASAGPAQIAFTPNGDGLIVTERVTNIISVFRLDPSTGLPLDRRSVMSSGQTPFGFEFTPSGTLVVTEAFGGADSAMSSYALTADGFLSLISGSVDAASETDACWVTITRNGKRAYETNTNVGSISSYTIGTDGTLSLLQARAARNGGLPIDLDLSPDDKYLYTLNFGSDKLEVYSVAQQSGALSLIQEVAVPAGSNGVWVR